MNRQELLKRLTHADEDVRREAREELHMVMDDEIALAFLGVARGEGTEAIRADSLVGLGPVIDEAGLDYADGIEFDFGPELGPPVSREVFKSIVDDIRRLYEDEAQPKVIRRRALEVLVRSPEPWLREEIRKHYASDDADWKLTSVFAMGFITGFDEEIAETVKTADESLLFEALNAAGSMGVTSAARRVRELAQSSRDMEIRVAAIEALPNVDPDGAAGILQQLIGSDEEEVARTAEAVLDELLMDEGLDDLDDDDDFDDDDDDDEEEVEEEEDEVQ
jgi:hypothetical protein